MRAEWQQRQERRTRGSGPEEGAVGFPERLGPSSVGRPEIKLSCELNLILEDVKIGDSVKDAVLADTAEPMRAVDATTRGTDSKGFRRDG